MSSCIYCSASGSVGKKFTRKISSSKEKNHCLILDPSMAVSNKEFIIKMEGNTGEFFDISGSEIHGGRCVQSIR
jgi:hypothetical protein